MFGVVEQQFDLVGRYLDGLDERRSQATREVSEAEGLYLQARAMLRSGRVREATSLFSQIAEHEPKLADVAEGYGEGLDRAGEVERAQATFAAYRSRKATLGVTAPDRSFVLRRIGRPTAEIADYSLLLRSISDRAFPYIARGNAHLAMGRPRQAVVDYVAALGCNPRLVEVVALKAEALSMMGRYEDALVDFDRALAEHPNDPDCLNGRAIVHIACDRVAQADADWRRQLASMPAERASARACVALRMADYAVARPELDRAIEREPRNAYWQLYRWTAGRRTGEPLVVGKPMPDDTWPTPLIELHAGRLRPSDVLERADSPGRQVEAHYQLGILALTSDPGTAQGHFRKAVDLFLPAMIEHAAARHELMRWNL